MLRGKSDPVQNSAQGGKTRDDLAKIAGVSHDTINRVEFIPAIFISQGSNLVPQLVPRGILA